MAATQETLEAMISYDWPGNVRELENCIQHMVAINSGPLVHTMDLPSMLQNHVLTKRSQSMAAAALAEVPPSRWADPVEVVNARRPEPVQEIHVTRQSSDGPSPVIPLMEMEKRAIMDALAYTKGDRAVAAGLLGIGSLPSCEFIPGLSNSRRVHAL